MSGQFDCAINMIPVCFMPRSPNLQSNWPFFFPPVKSFEGDPESPLHGRYGVTKWQNHLMYFGMPWWRARGYLVFASATRNSVTNLKFIISWLFESVVPRCDDTTSHAEWDYTGILQDLECLNATLLALHENALIQWVYPRLVSCLTPLTWSHRYLGEMAMCLPVMNRFLQDTELVEEVIYNHGTIRTRHLRMSSGTMLSDSNRVDCGGPATLHTYGFGRRGSGGGGRWNPSTGAISRQPLTQNLLSIWN